MIETDLNRGTLPRIAIIGAGISGLSAAWTLHQHAHRVHVTIFEASDRAGGVLQSIDDPPYLIERSADNFATLHPDALELCTATGYLDNLIRPQLTDRQAFVLRRGRILPIPAGFSLVQPTRVWPILTTRILSWRGKLRLLSEAFIRPRTALSDESLQEFALRRLGREGFERLVEPIVSGIFTADPSKLSMLATLPQFAKMEREQGGLMRAAWSARRGQAATIARRASGARYDQFVAPRLGMSHWVEHLVRGLPAGTLRLQEPVQNVARNRAPSSVWQVTTARGRSDFDGVIFANATHHAAALLHESEPDIASQLAAIEYASSAVVTLVVDRSELRARVDGFGLIVPSIEHRPVLAISYASNKYAGRAPDDQIMLRMFLGGARAPQILQQSDSQLIATALQQTREILLWQGKLPKWQGVVRWSQAMPQYHVGHMSRVAALNQSLATAGSLQVCGAAYMGVGIPQTVRSGRTAAQAMLTQLVPTAL